MFYKYEINNINGEDVLYLFLTLKYEFSKELSYMEDKQLSILSSNFIQSNNIPYNGNKIYLVVDGTVVKKLDINNKNLIGNDYYLPDKFLVNIRLEDNSLCEITLRDYLQSVLLSLYEYDLGDEVLKAICILFNTYAYKMMKEEKCILANNSFCLYKPVNVYIDKYKNIDNYLLRINRIISDMECIYIGYEGDYILPFIHYSNSGKTLSNIKYPYLNSVKSLWDLSSPSYISVLDVDYKKINKLFQVHLNAKSNLNILQNGTIIQFGDKNFTVNEIKNTLKLKSNDIYIIVNKDGIRFITKGVGNSLGLSIYGASCCEKNDGKYTNILKYYFPNCKLYKYTK